MPVQGHAAYQCPYYLPGHTVHFIQARTSWNSPTQIPVRPAVDPDLDVVQFTVGEEPQLRWNHDSQTLRQALVRAGGEAMWRPEHQVLAVPTPSGQPVLFSLAHLADVRTCQPQRQWAPRSSAA